MEFMTKGNRKRGNGASHPLVRNRICLSLFFALTLFFLTGKASIAGASVVVDRVVAVVNDDIITMSDLERETAKTPAKADQRILLEDMINRKLQMAAAKRAGMDVTEKELNEAVDDIMKRNGMDRKQFETALAKEGLSVDQYRQELKEQMTLSRVFNKFVRSGLAVEENELRAYYDRNPVAFRLPEEVRVRQILLRIPEKASSAQIAAVREKAFRAAERAAAGEDFSLLVREYADAVSAASDGDLGFMRRDEMLSEIEKAIAALKPGAIAGPVQSALGFHVLRVEEVRTRMMQYEKIKSELSTSLYNQKLESAYRGWLKTLRSESNVDIKL